MEHEIVNRETPEIKQLISGIKEVSKRLREIAQTHRPLFGEKSTSRGERSANAFSSVPAPCRTIGARALFPTPRSQGKFSIAFPTSTDYCKRTIGDKVFARCFFLPFGYHTERICRMVVQKMPSNLAIARYLFADYSVSFRNKSSTFALLVQEISPVDAWAKFSDFEREYKGRCPIEFWLIASVNHSYMM